MATFEQVTLEEHMVPFADLMKEGQEVTILFHAETESPLTCVAVGSGRSLEEFEVIHRSARARRNNHRR